MSLYKPGRPTEVKPLDPSNTRKVPSAKGEYRIINSNTREVVYVGVSKDLNRRMHDHIRSGKLSGDNSILPTSRRTAGLHRRASTTTSAPRSSSTSRS